MELFSFPLNFKYLNFLSVKTEILSKNYLGLVIKAKR